MRGLLLLPQKTKNTLSGLRSDILPRAATRYAQPRSQAAVTAYVRREYEPEKVRATYVRTGRYSVRVVVT